MDMRGDGTPDNTRDDAAGGTWMTYDELAAARGIDRISAVKLALRNAWQKQRDKYRVARVHVPPEWAEANLVKDRGGAGLRGVDPSHDASAYATGEQEGQAEARAKQPDQARAAERAMWRKLLADERERADRAEQEHARLLTIIDGLEGRIAATEARADRANETLAAERTRADQAREVLAAEGARADPSKEALAAERTLADQSNESLAAHRAPVDQANEDLAEERDTAALVHKTLAAQHARAEQAAEEALAAQRATAELVRQALAAERARADQADNALAAERARTDTMKVLIDQLRSLLAMFPDEGGRVGVPVEIALSEETPEAQFASDARVNVPDANREGDLPHGQRV